MTTTPVPPLTPKGLVLPNFAVNRMREVGLEGQMTIVPPPLVPPRLGNTPTIARPPIANTMPITTASAPAPALAPVPIPQPAVQPALAITAITATPAFLRGPTGKILPYVPTLAGVPGYVAVEPTLLTATLSEVVQPPRQPVQPYTAQSPTILTVVNPVNIAQPPSVAIPYIPVPNYQAIETQKPPIASIFGANTTSAHQLIMPRINSPKLTDRAPELPKKAIDIDPWLPPKVDTSGPLVHVTATTPLGMIAAVPTAEKRPPTPRLLPMTPPRSPMPTMLAPNTPFVANAPLTPNRLTLKVVEPKDPLLTATIYLDRKGSNDRDYNYVAEHMRNVTAATSIMNAYANQWIQTPSVQGRVSLKQFEELLSIYENNQVVLQDAIDYKSLSAEDVRRYATNLEHWFVCIIEPAPPGDIESWRERERSKLERGYSAYCDPDLLSYIAPAPPELRNLVSKLQTS